jgi:hypothetical protein
MFTIEGRNRIRDRLLEMAKADHHLVAGAWVGSTAMGGDRWSDLDLTFGVADDASLADVLTDWTMRVQHEFNAVQLFDLPHQSTVYRVFLLPGHLQVDLSFTPRAEFGPRGPRFTLLFGNAVERKWAQPPTPQHLFGYAVHHLVRARIFIERGRLWQAEYWISSARDQVLSLACLRRGLKTDHGRGFDDLPAEIIRPFNEALVDSIDRDKLLSALSRTVNELMHNSQDVGEAALKLEGQLRELESKILS